MSGVGDHYSWAISNRTEEFCMSYSYSVQSNIWKVVFHFITVSNVFSLYSDPTGKH